MRQAIMVSPGIIEYKEIPKPERLGERDVLLKIERIRCLRKRCVQLHKQALSMMDIASLVFLQNLHALAALKRKYIL